MFEEHLLGGFCSFQRLFSEFSCRTHTSQFFQKAEFPCRTHHNSTKKPWNEENQSKISQFFCRTHLYVLNRLKVVNIIMYMKNSSCRTPPKLPGAKHHENVCFVYVARWLLSIILFDVSINGKAWSNFSRTSFSWWFFAVILSPQTLHNLQRAVL